MALPIHPALRELQNLDQSSPNFHDDLNSILHGVEYGKCVQNLERDDSVWFVDYLDKAIDKLDPSSPASRKCLRELKSTCGTHAVLPTSYILPFDVLNVGQIPFTSGGFGDVYKATCSGSVVCIKRLHVTSQHDRSKADEMFCREAATWKHLKHPNILPLLGVTLSPHQLVSNWMTGGDLSNYIKTHPDTDRFGLLHDTAKGLGYLHSRSVVHGDLKGLNIVVDVIGDTPRALLADFGVAIVTKNLDSLRPPTNEKTHTPRWSAPEILDERTNPSKESDVFSFAMVIVEVLTGQAPFYDLSKYMALLAIVQGGRPPRPEHPACTELLWTLMQRCWDQEPKSRPDVSEILEIFSVSASS